MFILIYMNCMVQCDIPINGRSYTLLVFNIIGLIDFAFKLK